MPIELELKAFRVLAYLIQHRDRAVPRDELRERFWHGEFITDSALAHCITKARQAVDDGGAAQRVIKSVHGHGYRFIAAVLARPPIVANTAVPPPPRPVIAEEASPITETPEPLADQPQASHRILEGERKQATVLAIGVKGIPALAQALDPEALPAVLRRLFDLMRAAVGRLEGRVFLATGGGLRAVFGAPIAHEDLAVRALHTALEVQRAFTGFADDLRRTQGITLTLRIRAHLGRVVGAIDRAGRVDDTVQGLTSYLADGLQQLARDGTIYVSDMVRRHTEGFFQFKDLDACVLPDIVQPVRI